MAPTKPAVDFNAMLTAERQRKKTEALAQEIFGKNRRASAPGGSLSNRKQGGVSSLASRIGPIGVTKRSASVVKTMRAVVKPNPGNVDSEWTHDLHTLNNPSAKSSQLPPRGPKAQRSTRDRALLHTALNGSASSPALNSQFNIVGASKPSLISIKGLAGPYTVIVKNLALGTTAADTESAMTPIGGTVLSCRLITERPKVIAEVIFETKEGADNVVDTLNNQNADGNILHVYHKVGSAPSTAKPLVPTSTYSNRSATPLGLRTETAVERREGGRPGSYSNTERFPRARSRDRRRDYEREDVQDGSFGFDDRMNTDDRAESGRGLYSDGMINNSGRGRGSSWDRARNDRGRAYNR